MSIDIKTKKNRINDLLRLENLDGVIFNLQRNFSWFLGQGGNDLVVFASERGQTTTIYIRDPEKVYLITTIIEMNRIKDEEILDNLDIEVEFVEIPWQGDLLNKINDIIKGKSFGSDTGILGTKNIAEQLAKLRLSLSIFEIDRYKKLGKETGIILESVARNVVKGDTEYKVAGTLAKELLEKGIYPTVVLIAGDERVFKYRHPIPTFNRIKEHGMLVICARRQGLIVAATRMIHFGDLDEELKKKHEAVVNIDATLIAESKPGVPLNEVLKKGIERYELEGFKDEWKLHHQGGFIGYNNREFVATPTSNLKILENSAIAWNPSITGTKSEDTILIMKERNMILTETKDWPYIDVEINNDIYKRPDILIL
jgi:Xaa-Pro dipeptidase